jgi:hypothetical protein
VAQVRVAPGVNADHTSEETATPYLDVNPDVLMSWRLVRVHRLHLFASICWPRGHRLHDLPSLDDGHNDSSRCHAKRIQRTSLF